MMDSVYPQPLSRLHRRAVRKKFHKDSTRYRTQPVTFAEIKEVDEESINDDNQLSTASKSDLDLKAKFEEFKRQRDRDLCEIRLAAKGMDNGIASENKNYEVNSKETGNKEFPEGVNGNSGSISVVYRGSSSYPRTSV